MFKELYLSELLAQLLMGYLLETLFNIDLKISLQCFFSPSFLMLGSVEDSKTAYTCYAVYFTYKLKASYFRIIH